MHLIHVNVHNLGWCCEGGCLIFFFFVFLLAFNVTQKANTRNSTNSYVYELVDIYILWLSVYPMSVNANRALVLMMVVCTTVPLVRSIARVALWLWNYFYFMVCYGHTLRGHLVSIYIYKYLSDHRGDVTISHHIILIQPGSLSLYLSLSISVSHTHSQFT